MQPVQSRRFLHIPTPANACLIQSNCEGCGALIAASVFNRYLAIAEIAHHCSAGSDPPFSRIEDLYGKAENQ